MDCTSGPSIESFRAMRISWGKRFAELVDNAFDAGARQVKISIGTNSFTITDDGSGLDDPKKLFTMGDSGSSPDKRLGRFGVGAKHVIYMGNRIRVNSVHRNVRRLSDIDVEFLERDRSRWKNMDDPDTSKTSDPPGTTIVVERVVGKSIPADEVREKLSEVYWPAIVGGRQILLSHKGGPLAPVPAWQSPTLKDPTIEGEHVFGDGRSIKYRAGIIADGRLLADPSVKNTMIAYHYRILEPTDIGRRNNPSAGVHVRIELREAASKQWKLDQHKGYLSSSQADDLDAVMSEILLPLFDAEKKSRQNVRIDGINSKLAVLFGKDPSTTTPRPGRGTKSGHRFGRGGGVQPPPPKNMTSDGTSKRSRKNNATGLKIDERQLGAEGPPYTYDRSEVATVITYNTDHALYSQKLRTDDDAAALIAVMIHIQAMPDEEIKPRSRKQLLLDPAKDAIVRSKSKEFGDLVSNWISMRQGKKK